MVFGVFDSFGIGPGRQLYRNIFATERS